MGHRAVQLLLGDIRQLPDLLNLCLSLGALELFHGILEELGVGRVSGILGDLSRVVFSGQLSGQRESKSSLSSHSSYKVLEESSEAGRDSRNR